MNNEKIGRRGFLKMLLAGTGTVLVVGPRKLGEVAEELISASKAPGDSASPRWAMIIDQSKCIGCGDCTHACAAAAQLALDRLHLLVEIIFPLGALHLVLHPALDLLLDAQDRHLALHHAVEHLGPLAHVGLLEQLLLLFDLRAQMPRDGIGPNAEALKHWADYSQARNEMFARTHTLSAPWTVVRAENKQLARINLIKDLLMRLHYDGKDRDLVLPNPEIVFAYAKSSIEEHGYSVAHIQLCDGGMTDFGYKTDFYRVLFFGKLAEVRRISEKYPELVSYVPLKLAVIAEKDDTLLTVLNPEVLAPYFADAEVQIQLSRWHSDLESILDDVRRSIGKRIAHAD